MTVSTSPLQTYYLHPGELVFTREPCSIVTALGSCVAVTMFHARLRLAAICHVMLADPSPGAPAAAIAAAPYRYASLAIPEMAARFQRAGARPCEIDTQLFGGSELAWASGPSLPMFRIGPRNLRRTRALLDEFDIVTRHEDVGTPDGRKLVFNTVTGAVACHRLSRLRRLEEDEAEARAV